MNITGSTTSETPLESTDLSRRSLLAGGLCTIAAVSAPAQVLAQNISNEQRIRQLLSDGLDTPENMSSLRRLIKSEIASAYRANPQSGYPTYDVSRIDNDAVFFGNVGGSTSNNIRFHQSMGIHYDDRIKGKINIGPENILAKVRNRLENYEGSGNIAFIMKDQNGVDTFIYYEAGVLKYIFPTTTGARTTPDNMIVRGGFHREKQRDYNDRQLANYYNINNSRGTMPYSRRLSTIDSDGSIHYEGINTHIGNVAPGENSHGCARQGALGACLLFHTMQRDTIVYYRPDISLDVET